MRVMFFGTPAFAVPTLQALLESAHTVVGVVSQPDRPRGRGHKVTETPVKALASAHGVPVAQPLRMKDESLIAQLGAWNADVGVVAAYGRILPDTLLAIPRLGMINVHASLLPRWRGAAPVHRAVIAGDEQTGVTIMQVVKELDAGDMLDRVEVAIGPDETSEALEARLATVGASLLVKVLDDLPHYLDRRTPQDATQATYAARLDKQESEIDWTLAAASIHNLVRGLTPWPLAQTSLEGSRLVVRRTVRPASSAAEHPTSAAPGTLMAVGPEGLTVACGHGSTLTITQVQPEGRRAMTVRDYLAGHPRRIGERFGRPS